MKKDSQSKQKKVEVYYINIIKFVWHPETWYTQQIYWDTFVRSVIYSICYTLV